jgi:SAM-dependent methyltransferase
VSFQDHFSTQARGYAKARPVYPSELFAHLARLAPAHRCSWDEGTGNGQAAVALSAHFERVVATEPSRAQLAQAVAHPRVEYHLSAETAPMLESASVDLVTVAQAVHWFDRASFYAETKRVLRPGGVLAIWSYEMCLITPAIDEVLQRFYRGAIWPCWPPERRHVEAGYRDFDFPFEEIPFPASTMEHAWTLAELAAYLRTWSSVVRYTRESGEDPVTALEMELVPLWGVGRRRIVWPLAGRVGRHTG